MTSRDARNDLGRRNPGSAQRIRSRYTGVETAIAVAALLVSIAQFAWQMYRALRKDRAEPSPQGLAWQLRLRVEVPPQVTSANRDRLIAVVGAERARAQLAAWQADRE